MPNFKFLAQLVTSEVRSTPQNRYWRREYVSCPRAEPLPCSRRQRSQLPCAALQFVLCHLRSVPAPALAECWPSVLALLRDAGQLTPPAQFLLLAVLNEYVQRAPPLPERKDQRDLQDVAAKVRERAADRLRPDGRTWGGEVTGPRKETPAAGMHACLPHNDY